jgi:hypothetical protein
MYNKKRKMEKFLTRTVGIMACMSSLFLGAFDNMRIMIDKDAVLAIAHAGADVTGTMQLHEGAIIGRDVRYHGGILAGEEGSCYLDGIFKPYGMFIVSFPSTIAEQVLDHDSVPLDEQKEKQGISTIGRGTVLLGDHDLLIGIGGTIPFPVVINGADSLIAGSVRCIGEIILTHAAAQLIWENDGVLLSPVHLRGGTISLRRDLLCEDNGKLEGAGRVQGNGRRVVAGVTDGMWKNSIAWHDTHIRLSAPSTVLAGIWKCAGSCSVKADQGIIDIQENGGIVVEENGTLFIAEATVRGVNNHHGIVLEKNAVLELANVTVLCTDTLTTAQGTVRIKGPTKLVLNEHQWILENDARLVVDGADLVFDVQHENPVICVNPEQQLTLLHNGRVTGYSSLSASPMATVGGNNGFRPDNGIQSTIGNDGIVHRITRTVHLTKQMFENSSNQVSKHVFIFDRSSSEQPCLVIQPESYGDRTVQLPSELIFRGDGIVRFDGDMMFAGTHVRVLCDEGAVMQCGERARISVGIQKCTWEFMHGGCLVLDKQSQLTMGTAPGQDIQFIVRKNSHCIIAHDQALLSFAFADYDIIISGGTFAMERGTLIWNGQAQNFSGGYLRSLIVENGGVFSLGDTAQVLCVPNTRVEEKELDSFCSMTTGTVHGTGSICLYDQMRAAFSPALVVHPSSINIVGSIQDIVGALTVKKRDGISYVQLRSGDAVVDGVYREGKIIELHPGDHHLFYDAPEPGKPRTVIRGYDGHNRLFTISARGIRQLHCQGGGMER